MKKELIIQSIIDKLKAQTYLEIGVQRGKNFYQISAPRKIAVDPQFIIGITRRVVNLDQIFQNKFYEETSDAFFERHAGKVFENRKLDVAFIDGLHTYEQSLKDFKNCLQYLAPGGVILFHDCNPLSEESGEYANSIQEVIVKNPDKIIQWTGDVWKTIVHLRSQYKDLEVFVLDCDFGVGVVRRGVPHNLLHFSEQQIQQLTYKDLESQRGNFLNLKAPEYIHEFVKQL